jgi:hypothetical protein
MQTALSEDSGFGFLAVPTWEEEGPEEGGRCYTGVFAWGGGALRLDWGGGALRLAGMLQWE